MRLRSLIAACLLLFAGQAQAYDASKAGTYVSPDMNNAHANTITLHGKGSTGPADTFNITLPNGSTMLLGDVVNPVTSPILAKFRAITATYEDFASAGDGKPWTESADVCPAINAAYAYLRNRGGGTLNLPPNVARCATPLRAPNMSFITTNGQGVGAFSQSGTELRWTGALGAVMLDLRATTAQTPVSGVRIYGLVLNGNGRAKTGLLVRGLKYSNIELLAQNTTFAGVDIDIDEAKGPLATGQLTGQDWAAYSTGSGGTNGTYTNVPLYNAGGTEGAGATADVTIANGSVSNIVIKTGGDKYVLGDILGIASANIGGTTGVFITAGNTGNAPYSNLDTSQNVWNLRVTQQGPASINAIGVRIGFGSSWLDTNSSVWLNVLTLTQNGTGFEIGDADTNEFIFTRVGIEGPGTGIGVDLLGGKWKAPSSARANHFGTISAVPGIVARAGAQPSTRNVVTKYNNESGEKPPVIEDGADINITDDKGNPIGNTGFTVNHVRDVYTPTVTRESGSTTSVTASADFRRFGREILGIRLDIKVTGGSGYIRVTLPCPPFKDTQITGFDRATGKSLQGRIGFADPSVYIYSADGTAPGSSSQPLMTGDLECSN